MTQNGHRPCPACVSVNSKGLGLKNAFQILQCGNCRTLFTDRLPTETESEDYNAYYNESNLVVPDFIRDRLRAIISEFEPYRKTNRLLDIGFGAGTILEIGKEMGWDVFGLEVSLPAVEQARSRGFEVEHGDLAGSGYIDNFFDVVTASEILEHLPDPAGDLKVIARILRHGGLFWGTTPNAAGISFKLMNKEWSMLSPPEHLQLYSRQGIRSMAQKAGFNDVKIRTHGVNPHEIARHFRRSAIEENEFSRVISGYELNESLTKDPLRRAVKNAINGALDLFKVGDSLKIFATKPKR